MHAVPPPPAPAFQTIVAQPGSLVTQPQQQAPAGQSLFAGINPALLMPSNPAFSLGATNPSALPSYPTPAKQTQAQKSKVCLYWPLVKVLMDYQPHHEEPIGMDYKRPKTEPEPAKPFEVWQNPDMHQEVCRRNDVLVSYRDNTL